MSTTPVNIELFAQAIPSSLSTESGKVFYSGRAAFSQLAPLYVLGLNPGGDPARYKTETVASHTRHVLSELPPDWSAYRDESWGGAPPGTYRMAPRVLHLFRQLQLQPRLVPASNLIFARSPREKHIKKRVQDLAKDCWPFHALVLEKLRPRSILCLGRTVGDYVCKKVGAYRVVGQFVEQNNRRWTSRSYENPVGFRVIVATHPSIADWCCPATDPSDLVREAIR